MRYWYNVRSGQVEDDSNRSLGEDVMGPYDTPQEAARALETARQKSEEWDAQERAWQNKGASPGWSGDAD